MSSVLARGRRAGAVASVVNLGLITASPLAGRLSDRLGTRVGVILVGFGTLAGAFALLLLVHDPIGVALSATPIGSCASTRRANAPARAANPTNMTRTRVPNRSDSMPASGEAVMSPRLTIEATAPAAATLNPKSFRR